MSSPYNYLAISEHLFSSAPTPPDLIYFLDMIILPPFADLSPETIDSIQLHFDRILAFIYFTLTLQLAALEVLISGTTTTVESKASPSHRISAAEKAAPVTLYISGLDMYYEDASDNDSGYSSASSISCSPITTQPKLCDYDEPRCCRRAPRYRPRSQSFSKLPTPILSASGKRMSWTAPRRTFASTKEVVARRASRAGMVLQGAGKAYGGAAVFA